MPLIRFYLPDALEELVANCHKSISEEPNDPDNPITLRNAEALQKQADELRAENEAHPDYPEYLEYMRQAGKEVPHGY